MTPVIEKEVELSADPVLFFLDRCVEQLLGIKAAPDALARLRDYLEDRRGSSVPDFNAYAGLLSSPEGIAAAARIVTINETYFFREPVHFRLLARRFLREFAKLSRPVRLCSAATSSGCEAYSLAMLMDFYSRGKDLFLPAASDDDPLRNGAFRYEIDAFDINPAVIEIARIGRFSGNTLREDGAEWRVITDLYLKSEGREYKVAQFLCDKVRFFTHNIMDGLAGAYDIIFFRNALIYFPPENRLKILDSLVNALTEGGILILGVSETPSVEHPLLESKHTQSAFYFQKKGKAKESPAGAKSEQDSAPDTSKPLPIRMSVEARGTEERRRKASMAEAPRGISAAEASREKSSPAEASREKSSPAEAPPATPHVRRTSRPAAGHSAPLDVKEIVALLEHLEGRPNAQKTTDALEQGEGAETLTESDLIAAAVAFLGAGDFEPADTVVSFLEKKSNSAAASFLRGEYHYLKNDAANAEEKYQEASLKDRAFWPAFYRISSLAAEGNRTRYEYKIKKALESMKAGQDLYYESFIGGFSPDYYRHILERKLSEQAGGKI